MDRCVKVIVNNLHCIFMLTFTLETSLFYDSQVCAHDPTWESLYHKNENKKYVFNSY